MDMFERVNSVFEFKTPDRLPQCNFFTDGFIQKHFKQDSNPYVESGYEIVPLFTDLSPNLQPSPQAEDENGIFTDGWGRKCRRTPASGFIEVLQYPVNTLETLAGFHYEPSTREKRFNKKPNENAHHPRSFSEEIEVQSNKGFLCGNVYDAFETTARAIGLKSALMALKTNPDDMKSVFRSLGEYMIELGLAQVNFKKGGLQGIWIWGDIAYTRGLMMSPDTWRELLLPPLKKMCSSFHGEGLKVIYHTDGNPKEVIDYLIEAGVDALHPTEQVKGMELEGLMDEFYGKLTFIGGIPPLKSLENGMNPELKKRLSKIIELGRSGGLIPGFSNFIPSSFDKGVLDSITKYLSEKKY